jgi:single-strand DNA-binding protein
MNQQNSLRLPEQNSVMLVGRLTRDPEVRRTGSGKAVCSFDIAISRRMKDPVSGEWKDSDPVYVPIIVWNEQGERCGERLKKGSPVHVEGRLHTNKWEGQDGTKRSRLEVTALRVQFLQIASKSAEIVGGKIDDDSIAPIPKEESPAAYPGDDDDIPF